MMIQISGKTYEWKNELKNEGFAWNPKSKTWDRSEVLNPEIFRERMILNAIGDGTLRYAGRVDHRISANTRTHDELYGQYENLAK
jgi:hypothetical protein